MGSHVDYRKVTGASPNSSNNPTPISSSVLNGENPSEQGTQNPGNVPVIKVNGKLHLMYVMTVQMMVLLKKFTQKVYATFSLP